MMKLVPVTRERHGSKRLRPLTTFAHAAGRAAVEVVFGEIGQVAANYPVFAVRQTDGLKLVAMLGVSEGENLYVDPAGHWTGLYVPVVFRAYPFTLGMKEQGGQLAVLVDEESGMLSDTDGDPLFSTREGEAETPMDRVVQLLTQVAADGRRTTELVNQLDDYGLLKTASVQLDPQGTAREFEGVLSVDETALAALPDDRFLELRQSGGLALAYAQLFSLAQFGRLQSRLSQRESGRSKATH